MRIKSNKLKKIEKNRFSILTEDLETCYNCKSKATDINEIYEGAKRITSIKFGCCIPLCRNCHKLFHYYPTQFASQFEKECQRKFEELYSYEEFMKNFHYDYLWKERT